MYCVDVGLFILQLSSVRKSSYNGLLYMFIIYVELLLEYERYILGVKSVLRSVIILDSFIKEKKL